MEANSPVTPFIQRLWMAGYLGLVGGGAGNRPADATGRRGLGQRGVLLGVVLAVVVGSDGLAGQIEDETPTEASIACATADVLGEAQVSQPQLDDLLSNRFLDGYLDALDSSHLVFLQSDVDEFGWFRPDLAQMAAGEGDTWPAHLIFARYLRRLAAQVDFETNFVQTAKFEFNGTDSWQPDRRDLPRPRDPEAARALWREVVRADYLREKLGGLPPSEIVARLTRRYDRRLQVVGQLQFDEVLEIYLDALAHAFDPHSDYFGHEEAREFNNEMNLTLSGIGGSLAAKDGYWIIGELVPGGPAARSGRLHPGDRIVAVAQGSGEPEEVTDLPSWRVLDLIRGVAGSTVRLTIIPAGREHTAQETVSLAREDVKLTVDSAKASIVDLTEGPGATCRLGVVSLPLFYESSPSTDRGASADTARLIQRLKQAGVMGLILDLRSNPGGSLTEAIKLTGLFIPGGPVLQTRDALRRMSVESSPGTNALYSGPLVVLTSRRSASASEIVAGTLQDYGRALIVGDSSTFGKGTLQSLVPLKKFLLQPGSGTVKVTVAKFYRPSGDSTQLKGVVPDIVLPSETDLPEMGEARLENALPWDSVAPTAYQRLNLVRPVLATLREKSSARVAADPWFQLVRQELAAQAAENGRAISLNESLRRQEDAKADHLQQQLHQAPPPGSARERESYDLTPADFVNPAKVTKSRAADDMELREAENILADYVQSMQTVSMASPSTGACRPNGTLAAERTGVPKEQNNAGL